MSDIKHKAVNEQQLNPDDYPKAYIDINKNNIIIDKSEIILPVDVVIEAGRTVPKGRLAIALPVAAVTVKYRDAGDVGDGSTRCLGWPFAIITFIISAMLGLVLVCGVIGLFGGEPKIWRGISSAVSVLYTLFLSFSAYFIDIYFDTQNPFARGAYFGTLTVMIAFCTFCGTDFS